MRKFKSIGDEIFKKMSGEEKLKLTLRINDKIFKIAKRKIKTRYPDLDSISFSKKLYEHLSFKRELYDNLFNQFLEEELKNIDLI